MECKRDELLETEGPDVNTCVQDPLDCFSKQFQDGRCLRCIFTDQTWIYTSEGCSDQCDNAISGISYVEFNEEDDSKLLCRTEPCGPEEKILVLNTANQQQNFIYVCIQKEKCVHIMNKDYCMFAECPENSVIINNIECKCSDAYPFYDIQKQVCTKSFDDFDEVMENNIKYFIIIVILVVALVALCFGLLAHDCLKRKKFKKQQQEEYQKLYTNQ